jgi:hypothetical protein
VSAERGTPGADLPLGNVKEVLVCFAVKEEAAPFRTLAAARPNVRVVLTGMGGRNAERAIEEALKASRPGLVLTCGFAGGLRPGLKIGTVVFDLAGNPRLESILISAGAQRGCFSLSQKVLTKAEEKRKLWEQTKSDAVDMESQAIREICSRKGIPSATVRVILDTAEVDLPLDFNELLTSDQQLDNGKLALMLMRSPGKIPMLMRLQKQSRAAAEKLAEVLGKVCAVAV